MSNDYGKDGDGFTVVQAMRRAHPKCVTILLTGYPAFESAVQALHDEVDDYFVKPADLATRSLQLKELGSTVSSTAHALVRG